MSLDGSRRMLTRDDFPFNKLIRSLNVLFSQLQEWIPIKEFSAELEKLRDDQVGNEKYVAIIFPQGWPQDSRIVVVYQRYADSIRLLATQASVHARHIFLDEIPMDVHLHINQVGEKGSEQFSFELRGEVPERVAEGFRTGVIQTDKETAE